MPHSSLAAQIAANSRWSKEDPTEQGRIMRAGLERRFLDEVDPNRELPEAERLRRVECAKEYVPHSWRARSPQGPQGYW